MNRTCQLHVRKKSLTTHFQPYNSCNVIQFKKLLQCLKQFFFRNLTQTTDFFFFFLVDHRQPIGCSACGARRWFPDVQNEEINSAHPMRKYARASRSRSGWDGRRVSCADPSRAIREDVGVPDRRAPIVSWPDRYMRRDSLTLPVPRSRSLTLSRALCLSHLSSRVTPPLVGPVDPEEGPPTQPILSEVSAN